MKSKESRATGLWKVMKLKIIQNVAETVRKDINKLLGMPSILFGVLKKTSSNIPDVHRNPIIRKRWPSLKTYNVQ